jgi:DNA-binding transcriptional ArsR family regulator
MGVADVFQALADPGRRTLLDALADRDGQTLVELCGALPDLSRFGVMKHLGVLADAHLLTTEKIGREKFHYLNRMPIVDIYERWVTKFTAPIVEGLAALKHDLEYPPSTAAKTEKAG